MFELITWLLFKQYTSYWNALLHITHTITYCCSDHLRIDVFQTSYRFSYNPTLSMSCLRHTVSTCTDVNSESLSRCNGDVSRMCCTDICVTLSLPTPLRLRAILKVVRKVVAGSKVMPPGRSRWVSPPQCDCYCRPPPAYYTNGACVIRRN